MRKRADNKFLKSCVEEMEKQKEVKGWGKRRQQYFGEMVSHQWK